MFPFIFPDVAEGIREGKLIEWKIKEGDVVQADQVLCEVETDKSVIELPSPKKGVVAKLHFRNGDTLKVGEVLVTLDTADDIIPAAAGKKQAAAPAKKHEAGQQAAPGIHALPKDRRLAHQLRIDLSKLSGTGTGGRITEADIRRAGGMAAQQETPAEKAPAPLPKLPGRLRAPPSLRKIARELGIPAAQLMQPGTGIAQPAQPEPRAAAGELRIKIEGIRAVIKKRMEAAWRIPHAAVSLDVDAGNLVAHRESAKEVLAEKGIKLTYLAYIVKAAARALDAFPLFNASIDDAAQEFVLNSRINIGVAVDTDYGLVVPNIKDCNRKTIPQIAGEIQELAQKARNRKLSPAEVSGGTFSITNVGSFGGTGGAAIINHPEAAILMVCGMTDRVRLIGGKPVLQKVLPLLLAFDHRIVDGADAGRFLHVVLQQLQNANIRLDVV